MGYKFFGKHMTEEKINLVGDLHYEICFSNGYAASILPFSSLYDEAIDDRAKENKFEAMLLQDSGEESKLLGKYRPTEDPIISELSEEGVIMFLDEVEKR